METKGILLILSVAVCGLFFWPVMAEAKLVTIEIEAVVDYVDDDLSVLEGKINVGDIITGWYTYDTSTPDTNPLPYVGDYEHHTPPSGISLSVGGFEFKTDPANIDFLVEIINDSTSGGLHDSYVLISYSNLSLSNGASVDTIAWFLRDASATALSSTELSTTAPVLDQWQANVLSIESDRAFGIRGHVTSAIPEPTAILLLTVGALLVRKGR